MTNAKNNFFYIFLLLFFIPFTAHGDVGIPTLALAWPGFWGLLIPIIILEAYVGVTKFHFSWKESLKTMALANLFSTLVGIPLAWISTFTLQYLYTFVSYGAFQISPAFSKSFEGQFFNKLINYSGTLTMIAPEGSLSILYVGALMMCLPYCFISYLLEFIIIKGKLAHHQKAIAHSWALYGNLLSYTTIIVILIFLWMMSGINN